MLKGLAMLQIPDLVFSPSLDDGVPDGLLEVVDALVTDIFRQASKIRRLATHKDQTDYQVLSTSLPMRVR